MEEEERGKELINRKLEKYFDKNISPLASDIKDIYHNRKDELIRELIPMKNHLNFSLYEPSGRFRGRWDSPHYYNKKVTISNEENKTSNGFIGGILPQGEWKIEFETHGIMSEKVNYKLQIWLYEDNPPIRDWFKGELHLHSDHSDGKASIGELVESARKEGLDFFALTDHNTISGWRDAENEDFTIIPGMEFSTFYGHSVGLGMNSYIDWRTNCKQDNFSNKINEVHKQNGLFSLAHPYVIGSPVCMGCEWEYENIAFEDVDLIEIWSGIWSKDKNLIKNRLALNLWKQKLKEGKMITGIGANDLHNPDFYERYDNYPLTFIKARSLSVRGILEALKRGRTYISSGPEVDFLLETLKGETVGQIGDRIKINEQKYLAVLDVEKIADKARVKLYKCCNLVDTMEVVGGYQGRISFTIEPESKDFYYWEIEGTGNNEILLITNPVFFKKEDMINS